MSYGWMMLNWKTNNQNRFMENGLRKQESWTGKSLCRVHFPNFKSGKES